MERKQLSFGKYKGKTLPQIVLTDPDWFFWAHEEGVLERMGYAAEANEVFYKARHIKLPKMFKEEAMAEYVVSRGKFMNMEIVPASKKDYTSSSKVFYLPFINLNVPRRIREYDKLGGQLLLIRVKQILFNDGGKRMTRKFCNDFFSENSNFK